jgi:GT2 family glycosyltransferase
VHESGHPVDVVVLAWQQEPWLAECVDALLRSAGVEVRVVLVDNGCEPADMSCVRQDSRVSVVRPGINLGFAGGCNLGAEGGDSAFVALVNSDCIVQPDTLCQLVDEASAPHHGPVMASIRFADDPDQVNSWGNPVHLVGVSWAGGLGAPELRTHPYDVTAASGACLVLRRSLWEQLGGFDREYFAYVEDTELSLRSWRRGCAARCVPTAIALHHYEFSRNHGKMLLLERNRLLLVMTMWSRRALALLAPVLLAFELAVLAQATAGGWLRQKVAGWSWLWAHRDHVRARRRLLREEEADPRWMQRLTPELEPHVVGSVVLVSAINAAVRGYWALVRALL